jgi:phosphate transport system protein
MVAIHGQAFSSFLKSNRSMSIRHFELELVDLKRSLVGMGGLVEQSLKTACDAIQSPSVGAREQVRGIEERLDILDVEIEDRCHQIMALQHPVASDLRLLISALHITADLEQIGDLAESICKRASFIARNTRIENPEELAILANLATEMVHLSLDAFISGTTDQAGHVMALEKSADQMTKRCYEWIQVAMAEHTDHIREYTHLLRAVAHLEHIADIAVAVAQEAVYVHLGRNVRHRHDGLDPESHG